MFDAVLYVWFFLLGLIVGSFLNVVIYRLHTGRTLRGRSHCLSCGKPLKWYHLFPVASYIALRARCAYCEAWVPLRYPLVELITGFSFLLVVAQVHDLVLVPLYLILMAVLIVIVVYDLAHTIIPDECVIALCALALAAGGYEYAMTRDITLITARIVAGAAGFSFFAALWYVSGGRWLGFGDAKLALPLGFLMSWPAVVSGIILSFWLGSAVSIALLLLIRLLKRGQIRLRIFPRSLTMKSEVPFAPFLIGGFLLAHLFGLNAFELVGMLMY